MEEELMAAKENFLNRFNQETTEEEALNKAVNRSVQRAYGYTPGTTQVRTAEIRKFWKEQIFELCGKYIEIQTIEVFENDIIELKNRMNKQFPHDFNNPHCVECPGFRIAQSQKSLSLYLKHLWCMDMIPTPPVCPVDTIILRKTAIASADQNWICICTLEEYYIRLNAIQAAAGEMNVAEWELVNY